MSIKIHHGPNGSYKTSGAIQDDAVRALKEGRLIITNVRGFTLERVLQVMPDLPDSVDIINLDLEKLDDMERMRTWFQWAPRGAFLIFDETQLVFPKAWREKDLERFDYPGGSEEAQKADRPISWLDGWTRHRHWNWDIVLTTPNISYIRDDIRMTCEMAYKHSNLAVIGIGGRYKEAQHDAQLNRPPEKGTIVEFRKIKPDTFKLYQSTATGLAQDTKAGKSLLRSPKLLALLVFMALLIGAVFSLGGVSFGPSTATKSEPIPAAQAPADTPAPAAENPAVPPDKSNPLSVSLLGGQQAAVPPVELNHPYAPRSFVVRAVMTTETGGKPRQIGQFDVVDGEGLVIRQSLADLHQLGYQIHIRGSCIVDISHPMGFKGKAFCPGRPAQREETARRFENGSPVRATPSQPAMAGSLTPARQSVNVVPDGEYASRPWR